MAAVPDEIMETVRQFVHMLSAGGLHLEKTILFGSCARGDVGKWSDIDLALVSRDFSGSGFYDRKMVNPSIIKVDSRIEPHPFRPEDFTDENPFVEAILKEGVEIQ